MRISALPPLLLALGLTFVLPLSPGWLLILGGLLLPLVSGAARSAWCLGLPLLALVLVWLLPDGPLLSLGFLDYTLVPVQGTAAGRLFATAFCIAAFAGLLFARGQRTLELAAALVYAGAAVSVTLCGDLLSLFVFWEVMALASTLVIWSAASPGAWAAGFRYILLHLLGGAILMAGIAAQVLGSGSVAFGPMDLDGPAAWLIFTGFLINAGGPPLWAWLADAYPEASYSGTVFLSAFTTKTAVYVLWVGFPGAEALIWLGLIMVFYGIVYALLENDIRRLLVYSIVSQVGYMLAAIGIGTELALNGAAAHAFAHIVYKALLLMSAGAVLYRTGRHSLERLGGLARAMPWTALCATVGALSISAFPFTSGFVSKSLIIQAAAEQQLGGVWLLLTAASAAAFLYVGLRYPYRVFSGPDRGLRPAEAPAFMGLAMGLLAGLCVLLGVAPALLYPFLPYPVDYAPYTAAHVVAQLQLLVVSGLVFLWLLPWLPRGEVRILDLDWFYRRLGYRWLRVAAQGGSDLLARWEAAAHRFLAALIRGLSRHHGPYGELARSWPTGSMVLWMAVLLATCLIFYYF